MNLNDDLKLLGAPLNDEAAIGMWVLLQLMGNRKIAGYATPARPYGTPMLEVAFPETSRTDPFTRYYSPAAIYSLTPITEAVARDLAERLQERKLPEELTI